MHILWLPICVYKYIKYIWHVLAFINISFQSLLLIFSAPFFSFLFLLQEFPSLFIAKIPMATLLVAHSLWMLISYVLLVAVVS